MKLFFMKKHTLHVRYIKRIIEGISKKVKEFLQKTYTFLKAILKKLYGKLVEIPGKILNKFSKKKEKTEEKKGLSFFLFLVKLEI